MQKMKKNKNIKNKNHSCLEGNTTLTTGFLITLESIIKECYTEVFPFIRTFSI
jgi:hypothetical protein